MVMDDEPFVFKRSSSSVKQNRPYSEVFDEQKVMDDEDDEPFVFKRSSSSVKQNRPYSEAFDEQKVMDDEDDEPFVFKRSSSSVKQNRPYSEVFDEQKVMDDEDDEPFVFKRSSSSVKQNRPYSEAFDEQKVIDDEDDEDDEPFVFKRSSSSVKQNRPYSEVFDEQNVMDDEDDEPFVFKRSSSSVKKNRPYSEAFDEQKVMDDEDDEPFVFKRSSSSVKQNRPYSEAFDEQKVMDDEDDEPFVFKRSSSSVKQNRPYSEAFDEQKVMDDEDDEPFVFKRSSSSVKQNRPYSETRKSLSEKNEQQSGRRGPPLNCQSTSVEMSKMPPVKSHLTSPKSYYASAKASSVRSSMMKSRPSTSMADEQNSVDRQLEVEKPPSSGAMGELNWDSEDSEDDKPLSSRFLASLSKVNSNHSHRRASASTVGQKSKILESEEESYDEIPLSWEFVNKSNVWNSVNSSYISGERKGAASIEKKPSTVLKKRPADSGQSTDASSLKNPTLSVAPPPNKKRESSIEAEMKEEDDEDHIPISERIKKTASLDKKSASVKKSKKFIKNSKSSKVLPSSDEGHKWTTLVHNGEIFLPPYKPHGVKMLYKNRPIDLNPEQEEMLIFVRNPQGNTSTLNVEKNETICRVKRKLKEKEGIRSDLHLGLIYNGKFLEDGCTVSQCNILKQSTLHLFLSQHTLSETWKLYIKTRSEEIFTLKVTSVDTIDDVKAKIQEKKGIPTHNQLLFDDDNWLEDGSRTLAEYDLFVCATLHLAIQFQEGPQQNVASRGKPLPPCKTSEQAPQSTPLARQAKRPCPATQTTPTKAAPNSHSIVDTSDEEAIAAPGDMMPEIRAHPPSSVLTELEDLKREMASARSKEKELEATITELTQKNKEFSSWCASYEIQAVALEIEITKTKEELTVACIKKKELETSYESQMVCLKDENKETKEELMVACSKKKELEVSYERQMVRLKNKNKETNEVLTIARKKGKELEATITELTQSNKELSSRCASYEIQAFALEAENKKIKEEHMVACRKKKELEASYESQMLCLKDENKETKEKLTRAHNKGKELDATITELTQKNKELSSQCASYEIHAVALEAENKKIKKEHMVVCRKKKELEASYESQMVCLKDENKETKEKLILAHNKGKEQDATITELTQKIKELSSRCASYEIQAVALEAENQKTKEELRVTCSKKKELEASYESQMVCFKDENKETRAELTLARNKGKELEATISRLAHKNRVFSDQCASYESQVITLEIENKKTKEELMNADKKYYSAARAAGYTEGLKEGKAKRLKSVEFLHHLTDASMQYFNFGFDSCQKQAEQQGFVGKLNKDSALKDAPNLKGWETN